MIGRDEDKLATVLGHEAAHVLARHSAEGVGLRLFLASSGWLVCNVIRTFAFGARKSYACAAATLRVACAALRLACCANARVTFVK